MRVDGFRIRMKSNDGRPLCRCDSLWFGIKNAPHRKGCTGCNYSRVSRTLDAA